MENEKLIIDAVTVLANKLGTTGTHLWEVLVRQAPISAITGIIVFSIGTLLAVLGWVYTVRLLSIINEDKEDKYDKEVCQYLAFILAVISFVISLICLINIDISLWISGIFNPEYWALNQVTHMFK